MDWACETLPNTYFPTDVPTGVVKTCPTHMFSDGRSDGRYYLQHFSDGRPDGRPDGRCKLQHFLDGRYSVFKILELKNLED